MAAGTAAADTGGQDTAPVRPAVAFYFDCACPWSYLALGRLRDAARRTGATILWRPVLTGDVLAAANPAHVQGQDDPNPRKARYHRKDLRDWARYLGLAVRRPARWPVPALEAQCAAVAADRAGCAGPFLEALFGAYFGDGRDIEERATILDAAAEAGLDPAAFGAALADPGLEAAVRGHARELVERGGFGVPSFIVGADDFYFGNDRLPLVEAALARESGMRLVLPGEHGTV